jgi:phage terminase small subunit
MASKTSTPDDGEPTGPKLTPKQQRFVNEYALDNNATQAAIRAGYSKATAAAQASRLLTNANVAETIAAAQAKQAERAEIDTAWVIARLVDETQNADKSSTRVRALELLGKHLGMLSGRIDPFSLRERAIVLAEELGLPVEEVVAEAEKIMRASERRR